MSRGVQITNFSGGGSSIKDTYGTIGGQYNFGGKNGNGYIGAERSGQIFGPNNNTSVNGGYNYNTGKNTTIGVNGSYGTKSGPSGSIGINHKF